MCPWGPTPLDLHPDASGHGGCTAPTRRRTMSFSARTICVGRRQPQIPARSSISQSALSIESGWRVFHVMGRSPDHLIRLYRIATAGHIAARVFLSANAGESVMVSRLPSLPLGSDPTTICLRVSATDASHDRLYLLNDGHLSEAPQRRRALGPACVTRRNIAPAVWFTASPTPWRPHGWLGGDIFPMTSALFGLEPGSSRGTEGEDPVESQSSWTLTAALGSAGRGSGAILTPCRRSS